MKYVDDKFSIEFTQSAIDRIKELCQDKMLRIAVDAGGCSGMQYAYEFVEKKDPEDVVVLENSVVIDPISAELLTGSVVDYVINLGSAYFNISNDKNSSRCGCGKSFAR